MPPEEFGSPSEKSIFDYLRIPGSKRKKMISYTD